MFFVFIGLVSERVVLNQRPLCPLVSIRFHLVTRSSSGICFKTSVVETRAGDFFKGILSTKKRNFITLLCIVIFKI